MPLFKNKSPGLNVFSSFKPTDHSDRLVRSFEEVQTFKRQLLKADAALHTYAKATEEVLKVTDDSLSSFPRAWRKADAAPNAAVLPEEDVTKAAPTTKKLGLYPSGKHVVNLEAGLQEEVYTPIERWHKQYRNIKTRIASVEASRLEYDTARKELGLAREAVLKHARKTDGRNDAGLDTAERNAEAVLAVKREAYVAVEEEVHVELLALTADAQQTLGYCARALQLNSRALMNAADGLAEKEAAMPVVDRQSSGPLALGGIGSQNNSPVGTPTSLGSPTGYQATFGKATTEAPSPEARTPTTLGDSSRMGRFDEAAALAAEQQGGGSPDIGGLNLGQKTSATADTSGTSESLPSAPTHTAGVADSASDLPTAPGHTVGTQQGTTTAPTPTPATLAE